MCIRDSRDTMDKIAAHLIEKETITGKEFMEIFHQAQAESRELQLPVNDEIEYV